MKYKVNMNALVLYCVASLFWCVSFAIKIDEILGAFKHWEASTPPDIVGSEQPQRIIQEFVELKSKDDQNMNKEVPRKVCERLKNLSGMECKILELVSHTPVTWKSDYKKMEKPVFKNIFVCEFKNANEKNQSPKLLSFMSAKRNANHDRYFVARGVLNALNAQEYYIWGIWGDEAGKDSSGSESASESGSKFVRKWKDAVHGISARSSSSTKNISDYSFQSSRPRSSHSMSKSREESSQSVRENFSPRERQITDDRSSTRSNKGKSQMFSSKRSDDGIQKSSSFSRAVSTISSTKEPSTSKTNHPMPSSRRNNVSTKPPIGASKPGDSTSQSIKTSNHHASTSKPLINTSNHHASTSKPLINTSNHHASTSKPRVSPSNSNNILSNIANYCASALKTRPPCSSSKPPLSNSSSSDKKKKTKERIDKWIDENIIKDLQNIEIDPKQAKEIENNNPSVKFVYPRIDEDVKRSSRTI